jgi:SAM-dependent methyltransferase
MAGIARSPSAIVGDRRSETAYRGYEKRADRIAKMVAPLLAGHVDPVVLEIGAAAARNLVAVRRTHPRARLFEDEIDRRWGPTYAEERIASWRQRAPGTKANLIILSHVVEHLRQPVQALKEICAVLAPDGAVYIEVPNVPSGPQPSLPYKLVHTIYFSGPTLLATGSAAGLRNSALIETDVIASLWQRRV